MTRQHHAKDHLIFKKDWPLFQQRMHACTEHALQAEKIPSIAGDLMRCYGKQMRAQLIFITAKLLGDVHNEHIALARAIEYVHAASLLHDDVLDQGVMRRGVICPHRIHGNARTILSGDWLLAYAFSVLLEVRDWDVVSCVQKSMLHLVRGQIVDCQSVGHADSASLCERAYVDMIQDKTAALFSASAYAAALISKATSAQALALKSYALNMGMAYQLQDDAAEYAAPAIYWDAGHDFFQRKITFPWIALQDQLSPQDWDALMGLHAEMCHEMCHEQDWPRLLEKYHNQLVWMQAAFQHGVRATYTRAEYYAIHAHNALLSCWQKKDIEAFMQWGQF